jgi:hypothetical protein
MEKGKIFRWTLIGCRVSCFPLSRTPDLSPRKLTERSRFLSSLFSLIVHHHPQQPLRTQELDNICYNLKLLRQDARSFQDLLIATCARTTYNKPSFAPTHATRRRRHLDTHCYGCAKEESFSFSGKRNWGLEVRQTSITSSLRVFDCIVAC